MVRIRKIPTLDACANQPQVASRLDAALSAAASALGRSCISRAAGGRSFISVSLARSEAAQLDQALLSRFLGTFLPSRRASARPIAIACLRLVTFLPLRPLRSVPRLRLRIARATFFTAPRE